MAWGGVRVRRLLLLGGSALLLLSPLLLFARSSGAPLPLELGGVRVGPLHPRDAPPSVMPVDAVLAARWSGYRSEECRHRPPRHTTEVQRDVRRVLADVPQWIAKQEWEEGVFRYGIPDFVLPWLDLPVGDRPNTFDLLVQLLEEIRYRSPEPVRYLEVGASAGKTAWVLLNASCDGDVVALDWAALNPSMRRMLQERLSGRSLLDEDQHPDAYAPGSAAGVAISVRNGMAHLPNRHRWASWAEGGQTKVHDSLVGAQGCVLQSWRGLPRHARFHHYQCDLMDGLGWDYLASLVAQQRRKELAALRQGAHVDRSDGEPLLSTLRGGFQLIFSDAFPTAQHLQHELDAVLRLRLLDAAHAFAYVWDDVFSMELMARFCERLREYVDRYQLEDAGLLSRPNATQPLHPLSQYSAARVTCWSGTLPGWVGQNEGDHRVVVVSSLPAYTFARLLRSPQPFGNF